jgi:prolyl-tRNA editing enzyme YbaK/EbsC (Cys-tRNA(Pro) deacylase)
VVPYGKRVNSGAVLKHAMDATKPSFANLDDVIAMTCMEFGSITPVGLPDDWQVLIDSSVKELDEVIVGGGRVDAKFKTTPQILAQLPHAKFVDQLTK